MFGQDDYLKLESTTCHLEYSRKQRERKFRHFIMKFYAFQFSKIRFLFVTEFEYMWRNLGSHTLDNRFLTITICLDSYKTISVYFSLTWNLDFGENGRIRIRVVLHAEMD